MIDITALSDEERQALACMFYARLPKTDTRYKGRKACFKLFQKRFNKKETTYNHSKDTYDAYFETNDRVGWVGAKIISRGQAYQDIYDKYKDSDLDELEDAVSKIIEFYSNEDKTFISMKCAFPETVHALILNVETITIDGVYTLSEKITKGRIIFGKYISDPYLTWMKHMNGVYKKFTNDPFMSRVSVTDL